MTEAANPPLSRPNYRPDLDGLRAIAVLAVVAFHAFPEWLLGGFIGVDIFYAISGYLISTVILEHLRDGSFSFRTFYARRVRRIFPALTLVLGVTLGLGYFVLLPYEYRQLGKDVAAGAAFISNFTLWSQSGYFDVEAVQKPLLHLWSLAIEEQFYIVWPLLLWFCWTRRINILLALALIGTASFVWNLHEAAHDPVGDFYSPLPRLFELLAGAGLAHLQLFKPKILDRIGPGGGNVLSLAGCGLLAAGFLLITGNRAFPGWWGLMPALGTTLAVAAGQRAWINRRLLSQPLLTWFGLISYPLYLWHWPLFSLADIATDDLPSRNIRIAIVLLSVLLAWLTWRFVETPVRFGAHRRARTTLSCAFMAMIATAALGIAFFSPALPPGQASTLAKLSRVADMQHNMASMWGARPCMRTSVDQTASMFLANGCLKVWWPGRPVVFLIGDSFSGSLSLGLRPMLEARKINLLQVSTGFCEPTSDDRANRRCDEINALALAAIKASRPDLVIFNSNWLKASGPEFSKLGRKYPLALVDFIGLLKRNGAKKVIVAGQVPTWRKPLPDFLAREFVMRGKPIPRRTFSGVEQPSLAIDTAMASIIYPQDASYLSIRQILCDSNGCLTSVGPDLSADLTVWDYGHLTPAGARMVANKLFAPVLTSLGKSG